MVGYAMKDRIITPDTNNAIYNANRNVGLGQGSTLLNMQLQVRRNSSYLTPGLVQGNYRVKTRLL